MTAAVKRIKQEDLGDALTVELAYANTGLDLSDQITTSTPVVFIMRPKGETEPVIDRRAAEVLSSTGGLVTVRHLWQDGDLDDIGVYEGEFEFALSGGPVTAPSRGYITVVVTDDIG